MTLTSALERHKLQALSGLMAGLAHMMNWKQRTVPSQRLG